MPLRPPRGGPSVHPWPRRRSEAPPRYTAVYTLVECNACPWSPQPYSAQVLQLPQVPARDPHLSDYAEAGAWPRAAATSRPEGGVEA